MTAVVIAKKISPFVEKHVPPKPSTDFCLNLIDHVLDHVTSARKTGERNRIAMTLCHEP